MYDVHLRLIEKHAVDFLLALTKLFSLGVTAEALQAKIDRKLEIRSVERGICPIAKSTMNELFL